LLARYPVHTFIVAAVCIGAFMARNHIADRISTAYWRMLLLIRPRSGVLATLRLLERRAANAGYPRPNCRPVARHFLSLLQTTSDAKGLDELVRLSCQALYELTPSNPSSRQAELCLQVGSQWSVAAIRRAAGAQKIAMNREEIH
jgi:hypothetical protein